jgi:transcriptional regulator with XRE-family HTH domain
MKTKIAQNLCVLRAMINRSQQEFADILRIKRSTYSAYELGTVEPDLSLALRFAKFYKVKLEDLLTKDLDPKFKEKPVIKGLFAAQINITIDIKLSQKSIAAMFFEAMDAEKSKMSFAELDSILHITDRDVYVISVGGGSTDKRDKYSHTPQEEVINILM